MPTIDCRSCHQSFIGTLAPDDRCPLCKGDPNGFIVANSPAPAARPNTRGPSGGGEKQWTKYVGAGALAATVVTVLGEAVCFAILHFLVPAWTRLLAASFSPTKEDVDRIVASRFGDVVMLLVFLPWGLLYVITLVTAVIAGRAAVPAAKERAVQTMALGVLLSVAAALVSAAIAWIVTGLLYSDPDSLALQVHRSMLASGQVLFAATFAAAAFCGVREEGNVKPRAAQLRPASFAACLLATGVATAVIVGIRLGRTDKAPKFDLSTYRPPADLVRPVMPKIPRRGTPTTTPTTDRATSEVAATRPTSPDAPLPADAGAEFSALRQAAEAGDAGAMTHLGFMYSEGSGGLPHDDAAAVGWFRRAAEAGDGVAMNSLGVMTAAGRGGLVADVADAVRWYRKGAEAGNGLAMNNLASSYAQGKGVPKDDTAAAGWFGKGAEAGEPAAMSGLAQAYLDGRGVRQNDAQGVLWYRRAAEGGDAMAMNNFGVFYREGLRGITKDDREAARWFRRSADAGYDLGMVNLALMYADGRGVVQNGAEAARWCRKAAESGEPTAMFMLGLFYAEGFGVPPDAAEARKWVRRAADAGKPEARQWLTANP